MTGLTESEAAARLRQFGANVVTTKKKLRPLVAFIKKFNSPLLIILMIVSVISFFTGNRINAVILVFMVLLSVILDFINTFKSERAVEQLTSRVVTTTTVIRGGKKRQVRLHEIVPGDMVELIAGNVIPADCRVLDSKDLYVNQSVLTGESLPVEKRHLTDETIPADFSPDHASAVLMGTSVVTGYATVEVLHTGTQTEFGKIAERLTDEERETDFERNIKVFSTFVMKLTTVMVIAVFGLNLLAHRNLLDSFTFAIAIAIGLTPELLPVILSVSLSRGAIKMSKHQVIVKHLPAIQNFGRMNILCTDKTGTLTENRIAVMKYVDGAGQTSEAVLKHAYLSSYFHSGVANPLDQAVRDYRTWEMGSVKKIDEIPFDFERKRESMVVHTNEGRLIITKGAPEEIFKICTVCRVGESDKNFTPALQQTAHDEFNALSQDGFKVLAVAVKHDHNTRHVYEKNDEQQMTFYGYIAFLDPPKESSRRAIDELEELGIEVKILTGDNELLTQKICQVIDIPIKGVLTGVEVAQMDDQMLQQRAVQTSIFGRITPEQKERIITVLQRAGNVVGYLGDGINDAPALKAADVGVSVNNAVDVAKETADIILLRKSLRVLKDGVIEGRKTFRNTLKYVMMGLSSNFGNMFSMTAASAFLPFLPMLPTQVLLNNFMYDMSQLTLSTDSVDREEVRKQSGWNMRFIRRYMMVFGPISSIFDFLTFALLLLVFRHAEHQFQTGWFIESIATQIFVIYVIRTKKIPFLQSRPSALLLVNTLLIVGIAWLLPYLPFAHFFNLEPLPIGILLTIAGLVLVYLCIVQFIKQRFYQKYQEA